tara:strand:+ start:373 stop:969 length:597 start_codon:yes stop_codon:yes gene_type:complete
MIKDILQDINEDKYQNYRTTSNKFKTDIWNFFNKDFRDETVVEFGTHKGGSTRVLSFLFKDVHTVNYDSMEAAKQLNSDRTNIEYLDIDLYSTPTIEIKHKDPVSVFLVDAGHLYSNVIDDMNRIFTMNCKKDCYIIFDDYGMNRWKDDVRRAIDEAIEANAIEVVKEIGHPLGHDFGGGRVLEGPEGLITKIKWNED